MGIVSIEKAVAVGAAALLGAGTAFYVAALLLGMALDLDVDAGDAMYLALTGVAGGVGLGAAATVGALLVLAIEANIDPDC